MFRQPTSFIFLVERNSDIDWCLIAFFIAVLVSIVESAKITKFHVPAMVYHDTEAILECDFTLDEKDDELVVKWYLNDAAVYQWIPGKFFPPS